MNGIRLIRIITTFCLVLSALTLPSCKDQSGEESRQGAANVDESGKMIRASRQQLNMTQQEINQSADTASESQKKQQAKRVVDRIEKPADFPKIEESISQLSTNLSQVPAEDSKALMELTSQVMAACQTFLLQQDKLGEQTATENKQRLQNAEKLLKEAVQRSQQNQNRDSQVGPELLLGTVKLIQARQSIGAVQNREMEGLPEHQAIFSIAGGIATEDSFAEGIKASLPDKTIAAIEARVEGKSEQTGEPVSLTVQLAQAEKQIQTLEAQQKTQSEQLTLHQQMAKTQQDQYVSLMEQSEKAKGDDQYKLYEQAYRIKVGPEDSGQPGDGVIYHESQTEILQSQLQATRSRLDYFMMQRQQLTQNLEQVKKTIAELRNSPRIELVQKEIEQSRSRRTELLAALTTHVDSFEKLEKTYIAARLDVVSSYDEARKEYRRVAGLGVSPDFRKAKDYARLMADLAATELAEFWSQDAEHYASCEQMTTILNGIPEIAERASIFQKNFQQQQQDARSAAEQLRKEIAENAQK